MGLLYSIMKMFSGAKEEGQAQEEYVQAQPLSLEIDEEDKLVVALAASIMAGKYKSGSYYHISSIKRIK